MEEKNCVFGATAESVQVRGKEGVQFLMWDKDALGRAQRRRTTRQCQRRTSCTPAVVWGFQLAEMCCFIRSGTVIHHPVQVASNHCPFLYVYLKELQSSSAEIWGLSAGMIDSFS